MASWLPENAIKAYLRALKMGKRSEQPDMAEFISALAAGNNAKLMVMACGIAAGPTILSLVAASDQTGGQVVCILSTNSDLYASRNDLGPYADDVKFVIGDASSLLRNDYKEADFLLIDCRIDDYKGVFKAAQECGKHGRKLLVGYNACQKGHWPRELKTHFLPIAGGLEVTRIGGYGNGHRKRGKWIVRVDKCTGEEHVYRIISPQQERETYGL